VWSGQLFGKDSSRAVLGEALQLVTYLSVTELACVYCTLYRGLADSTSATLTRQIYINHFPRRHGHESGNIGGLQLSLRVFNICVVRFTAIEVFGSLLCTARLHLDGHDIRCRALKNKKMKRKNETS